MSMKKEEKWRVKAKSPQNRRWMKQQNHSVGVSIQNIFKDASWYGLLRKSKSASIGKPFIAASSKARTQAIVREKNGVSTLTPISSSVFHATSPVRHVFTINFPFSVHTTYTVNRCLTWQYLKAYSGCFRNSQHLTIDMKTTFFFLILWPHRDFHNKNKVYYFLA